MLWVLLLATANPVVLWSQEKSGPSPANPAALMKPAELEQILAPIALYPDGLLAQVLMASTYPLEVAQAARWLRDNPDLKGDKAEAALKKKNWDPSVKSLLPFPQSLELMDKNLEWTQKLGETFLAQQRDVMDAVQRLRAKAEAAGNLKSTKEQTVIVEKTTATRVIKIEPATEVVYVPAYNPSVVYVTSYQPVVVYPPAYVVTTSAVSFGMGVAVGAAMWGSCHWEDHHNVVWAAPFPPPPPLPPPPRPPPGGKPPVGQQPGGGQGPGNRPGEHPGTGGRPSQPITGRPGGAGPTTMESKAFQHNPEHRQGVPYNNQNVANRYSQTPQARTTAQQNLSGRGYSPSSGSGSLSDRSSRGTGGSDAFSRGGNGAAERSASARGQYSRETGADRSGGGFRGGSGSGWSGGGGRGGGRGGRR